MQKLLMPVQGDFVAPRFDLATEIVLMSFSGKDVIDRPRTIIMERPSEEALCQMAVEENITHVICGGIEDLHYNFLKWKKIEVMDGVIGGWLEAMDRLLTRELRQGDILSSSRDEGLML